jgi:FkbM family methyltransferase
MDIVCFHVGGSGDYSHINVIGERYPKNAVYVAFEARDSEDDQRVKQEYLDKGFRTILVQQCVSDQVGTEMFNINVDPESSSIFSISKDTRSEHMPDQVSHPQWEQHAITDRVVEMETTTIDGAIDDHHLPQPDIISIDAQGADYKILQGAVNAIGNGVLSIITEVEFYQIYEGQPLFDKQQKLLHDKGFRLVDILAMQYWHPFARVGHGLLTVGEALFVRYGEAYLQPLSVCQLIKYAAIALAYNRLSVAVHAMNTAFQKYGARVQEIIDEHPEFQELVYLRQYVNQNMERYHQNAYFFEKDEFIQKIYGPVENLTNRSLP